METHTLQNRLLRELIDHVDVYEAENGAKTAPEPFEKDCKPVDE